MTDTPTTAGGQPLPFSRLLTHILEEHGGERLTFSELSARLRDRAWGGLLLIFAAINLLPLPPGTTMVTGLPLLVITAQMAVGRSRPWFPRKLDQRGIGAEHLGRVAARMRPWEDRIERILKPRWCALTNHRAARAIGLVCFALSAILWLPIPLGNHVPALAMTLFALALIYRDGLLVILGVLATIASLALVSVTLGAAAWALVQLWHGLTGGTSFGP
ncbi:MAG: exopolysaccharide biosynthesis protein [Pseudomonadota bacterium]